MVKIKRRDLLQMPLVLPDPAEQAAICRLIESCSSIAKVAKTECLSLERLSESLLQNLLTGCVRLRV